MAQVPRYTIDAPAGFASREVGSFLAQMDDQNQRLLEDLAGVTAAELEWQPAPGMNTIGMLLAHIAIVEVFWTQIGLLVEPFTCEAVLGIGGDDDGIPLPDGGRPPAALAGKDLAFHRDLLDRARAHSKKRLAALRDEDMASIVHRRRKNGEEEEFNKRWVLYHMLEHEAGHYGQVLLLRHQFKAQGTAAPVARR